MMIKMALNAFRRTARGSVAALLLAAAAAPLQATQYRVVTSDCLWNLAGKFYGNHFQWRRIAEANPQVKDPHWIYPNQILEIPDEGARPVEASVAIKVEPEPPAPEPEPVEEAAAPPSAPAAEPTVSEALPPGDDETPEGLSRELPRGQTAAFITARRIKVDSSFKPDATVIAESDGFEKAATRGDTVSARLTGKLEVEPGDHFVVYRQASVMETETDPQAHYLQEVGMARLERHVRRREYVFFIIKAVDTVQVGDWLKGVK